MARGRRKGRPISGWLCLDKPAGLTSTAVVNKVRWLTQAAKAGHGGTLDPLATGVLPVALGEATKTVAYVMDGRKAYRFTARLGEARTTDDAEGEVLATSELRPATAEIEAALAAFRGTIEQVPPQFAAVKVDGERAYDLARRGEVVELQPRTVQVDELRLVERPDPDHVVLELVCGRGTYVRSLVRDLGAMLGCLGHVVALRRLRVGAFHSEQAISLETLATLVADDALPQALIPVTAALTELPSVALTGPQAHRLRTGQSVKVPPQLLIGELPEAEAATVRAMAAGEMIALARLQGGELSPVRVFNS
jgi:tRNA pseudouridine55 synthase